MIAQWYRNLIARWNHERTLRRFAEDSPFTLRQIKITYSKVGSYERLEKVMDLAQKEQLSLWMAMYALICKETE